MPITALDSNTIKLITTTQIITSVYIAAKELIENAVDAGAKSIEINLIDSGASLIEVKDDGYGISKEDAPYMALSSYTSKISDFSDLESLHTYGFRGEALNALCKIAEVSIITKTMEDGTGTLYNLDNDGYIIKSEPYPRTGGTTVQIRNIFKQIPVRRQIITAARKANQDIKLLESLLKAFAICVYSIRINYRVNNNILLTKPSMPSMKEAVSFILGRKIVSSMDWIETEVMEATVKLMVPSKEGNNISEVFQTGVHYIFVNNRPIKNKDLEKVINSRITEYFGSKAPSKKKPIFVLYILTNPKDIDVNFDSNKNTVLLKNQHKFLDAIDNLVAKFYGITLEETNEQSICNDSESCYQDYTHGAIESMENEWPACKKRKVESDETTCVKELEPNIIQENHTKKTNIFDDSLQELTNKIVPPDLSDSDSNHSHKENLDVNIKNAIETLSQLPVVDLGEDFDFEDILQDTNKKENRRTSEIIEDLRGETENQETNSITKQVSLESWSKGHVQNIKGGTDVTSCINTNNPPPKINTPSKNKLEIDGISCKGFTIFSKHIRSLIIKENPSLTVAQIAQKMTDHWKELSPEERGYYRDLAREEQFAIDSKKQEKKEKEKLAKMDSDLNKTRFLNMLERMKNVKRETLKKKENLVMRTTVSWNINVEKVTETFRNKSDRRDSGIVIGQLSADQWIIRNNAQIWILNTFRLTNELSDAHVNADQMDPQNVEKLLKRWFREKEDMSLLQPVYSLSDQEITQSLEAT